MLPMCISLAVWGLRAKCWCVGEICIRGIVWHVIIGSIMMIPFPFRIVGHFAETRTRHERYFANGGSTTGNVFSVNETRIAYSEQAMSKRGAWVLYWSVPGQAVENSDNAIYLIIEAKRWKSSLSFSFWVIHVDGVHFGRLSHEYLHIEAHKIFTPDTL